MTKRIAKFPQCKNIGFERKPKGSFTYDVTQKMCISTSPPPVTKFVMSIKILILNGCNY